MPLPYTYLDICLQNCAGCGIELVSRGKQNERLALETMGKEMPPVVRGKMNNRPYCSNCLNSSLVPNRAHLPNFADFKEETGQ